MHAVLPPGMTVESLGGAAGFALSADLPGFRFDTVTLPAAGGNLESVIAANSPAAAEAARQAPAGTFLFDAGILPKNAFAGLPFAFSQAVNAAMAQGAAHGMESHGFPTAAEVEAEIARATATLGFDPRADLFDLLGDEFIAFSDFPALAGGGFGVNAVAAVSTTDPAALATTMQKLAAWIERSIPGANVAARQIDGDTVYTLSDAATKGVPTVEIGVVGGRAIISIGEGTAALQATPTAPLADDAQFKRVMAALPGEFSQISYVDLSRVVQMAMLLTGNMGGMNGAATPVAAAGSPLNLRALGAVTYEQDGKAAMSAILYIAEPGS
jgi:hypothetical protein